MGLEPSRQPPAALDPAMVARRFDDCLPRVYAFVASRVEDRSAAEEITATAFHGAVDAARTETINEESLVGAAFRAGTTAIDDHARSIAASPNGVRPGDFIRRSDHRRVGDSAADEEAARAFTAAIDRRALRHAIQGLPDAQRRVIVLHYLDDLSIDEQCAALGWSRETLARRVNGALRSLRRALTEDATDAA